jgi:putative transposase
MWISSIRPEDIRLPDESTELDAIMGRVYHRVLTHKGIEFEGLFYNSPDLTDLRITQGANIDIELRVDESDIGSIYVLSPKTNSTYQVPALESDYANGISLWQHTLYKKRQRKLYSSQQSPDGWLKAKEDIMREIEEEFHMKRRRTRMRAARHNEASKNNFAKPDTCKATLLQLKAPVFSASSSLITRSEYSSAANAENQAPPVASKPRHVRPRLKVTRKEGYCDE